jgi:hypothetical protein
MWRSRRGALPAQKAQQIIETVLLDAWLPIQPAMGQEWPQAPQGIVVMLLG